MAMTPGGIARTAGLYILIIATAGSVAIDFTSGNSRWGWFKVTVAGLVIVFEIHAYLTRGRTISTLQKDFMMRNILMGTLSLALFALALAGLILHLGVW